uniref:Uncharacterized protein n=1 Tax=Magallana gigas TaxID=29159 RepID=K1PXG5_MAGGI
MNYKLQRYKFFHTVVKSLALKLALQITIVKMKLVLLLILLSVLLSVAVTHPAIFKRLIAADLSIINTESPG